MNRLWFGLLVTTLLAGQDKPSAKVTEITERASSKKPTARAKARELLDNAAGAVAAAKPQVQPAGLMHIAHAYEVLDRNKAFEFYQQAFSSSAALSVKERENIQPEIVTGVAQLSLPKAIEMLRQIRPAPVHVVTNIVVKLLQKNQIDEAIELVENTGSTGAYSFSAVEQILGKLPTDDPKRVAVFSSAMSAYTLHPLDADGEAQRDFVELLARHWQEIPRSMAELSLNAIVNSILDRKDDGPMIETIATAKGSINLNSQKDVDLFDIINVAHALDPKRTEEILDKRPDLRAAFEMFPGGRMSVENSSTSSTSGNISIHRLQEMRQRAQSESRAEEAMAALEKDPARAVDIARTIEVPATKARVLAAIASSVGSKEPETARSVLGQCISMLDEVKDPRDRLNTWAEVAQAASNIKDEKEAWQAIDHGIQDATALYKLDADKETPNLAPIEYWPSTQAYRHIVSLATKLFGVDAEPLLIKIRDPDLALLAEIEMASTLLGTPGSRSSTMTQVATRKK